jgi:hypothetical protein
MNLDDILLEKEQEDLLIALVEAARGQPRDRREKFFVILSSEGTHILGLRDYPNAYKGDVEILGNEGLLNTSYTSKGTLTFDVTPLGFRYYEYLMKSRGEATGRIEENIFRYLDTSGFEKRHPDAFAKWHQAQELLWSSDSPTQHTAIGHHCREAMQFFATALVDAIKPQAVDQDITKTRNRLKAVIEQAKPGMSDKIAVLLDSLVDYWNALIGLSMRQEHGAQKEGEVLTWEDSRRLVFHTAIVMVEIDRTLKDIRL